MVGVPEIMPLPLLKMRPAGREGAMEKEAAEPAPNVGERLVMAS